MSPDQFCHAKVLSSKSNFSAAFLLLSRDKRKAIEALYAFCREIDDIGDSCTDIPKAKKKISLVATRNFKYAWDSKPSDFNSS